MMILIIARAISSEGGLQCLLTLLAHLYVFCHHESCVFVNYRHESITFKGFGRKLSMFDTLTGSWDIKIVLRDS